jgi:hypothetical protein
LAIPFALLFVIPQRSGGICFCLCFACSLPQPPELVILSGVADAFVSNAVEEPALSLPKGPAVVLVIAEVEQKREVPLA